MVRMLSRGLIVLSLVLIATGCAGQTPPTAVAPTTAPGISNVQAADPVATAPSTTPPSTSGATAPPALPTAGQEPVAPAVSGGLSIPGVYGYLLFDRTTGTLTETYDLQVYLKSTLEVGSASPVTITFTYEGIVVGTSAPTLTVVVTPGLTIIPTPVKLQSEGQGQVIATFTIDPPTNARSTSPCLRSRTSTDSLVFLATPLGVFIRKDSYDVFSDYLEHARSLGFISDDVYDHRNGIIHSHPGSLIVDLTRGQQSLEPFPLLPIPYLGDDPC